MGGPLGAPRKGIGGRPGSFGPRGAEGALWGLWGFWFAWLWPRTASLASVVPNGWSLVVLSQFGLLAKRGWGGQKGFPRERFPFGTVLVPGGPFPSQFYFGGHPGGGQSPGGLGRPFPRGGPVDGAFLPGGGPPRGGPRQHPVWGKRPPAFFWSVGSFWGRGNPGGWNPVPGEMLACECCLFVGAPRWWFFEGPLRTPGLGRRKNLGVPPEKGAPRVVPHPGGGAAKKGLRALWWVAPKKICRGRHLVFTDAGVQIKLSNRC